MPAESLHLCAQNLNIESPKTHTCTPIYAWSVVALVTDSHLYS